MKVHAIKTWFDSHLGAVSVTDDVLGVVQQIKQLDDRLNVFFNPQSEEFDIVETCLDGTDRLVFSVKELDARAVNRLQKADHWGSETPGSVLKRNEDDDFLSDLDRENDLLQEAKDARTREKLMDALERYAWAIDPGVGLTIQSSIHVKKDINGRSDD